METKIIISLWDLILGLITIISLVISIYQLYKRKQIQNHAIGIYSQLYDIIVEIDKNKIKTVEELKRLINQVRIEVISLNRNLKSEEHVIKPWDFVSKKKYKENIDWEKEKFNLKKQLELVKNEQVSIENKINRIEKSNNTQQIKS